MAPPQNSWVRTSRLSSAGHRGLAHFSARFALFAGDGAIAEECACPLPVEGDVQLLSAVFSRGLAQALRGSYLD